MKRPLFRTASCVLPMAVAMSLGASAHAAETAAGQDPAVAKAQALVSQMTLAEKVGQMRNSAMGIPRLGVPAYEYWNEALHGAVSELKTTNFPQPIGLAATFDDKLMFDVASAISLEVRGASAVKRAAGEHGVIGGGLDVWAPNINIFRDPRWGRGHETYGEDPYLTGELGLAFVRGLQGPDPDRPNVIATPKHFAVHSGPESTRHSANVDVSAHDLEDTYLPAFRRAIVDGRAGSIMCAYNAVNGEPACVSDYLLNQKLRGDWGFKGYMVSDCGAVEDLYAPRKYAPSPSAAAGVAVKAGMDNECSIAGVLGLPSANQKYADSVANGEVAEADIDRALVRVFAARYRVGDLGPFNGRKGASGEAAWLASTEHSELAQKSAEKSIVLLKNDGVLPLKRGKSTIAVIGPLADATRVLRGNYSSGRSPEPVSVVEGLKRAFPDAEIINVPAGAFVGDGDVVPSSALLTPDGRPGLLAEYFAPENPGPKPETLADLAKHSLQAKFKATPTVTRIETGVDTWPQTRVAGLPQDFQAVWSGFLVAPETGVYRLGLKGSVGNLIFDGQPLAKVLSFPAGLGEMKTVRLEKGRRYPIKVVSRTIGSLDVRLVWKQISETPEADMQAAAAKADVVVAVVGLTADLEGEEMKVDIPGFAGGDRTSLDLPADQQALLEAAKATGKPLVVVAMNGGALNLSWAKQNAAGLVEAWYPGQAGGAAVANVLSGRINPAGRLPLTFYKDVAELPAFDDYTMQGRTYRYFKGAPVYPFGYGLSYTSFAYAPLKLAPVAGAPEKGLQVSVELRNTGKLAGDEVAQLYLQFPDRPGTPQLALRGFQRIRLAAGERKTVTFNLSPRDLSSVSPDGERQVIAGQYRVSVGGGQPNTGAPTASSSFTVGEPAAIEK